MTEATPVLAQPTLGTTVLVVDDEPTIRDLAARAVHRLGLQAITKATGHQAVTTYATLHPSPSVVLMDVAMPGMDGWEASRQIRAIDPAVPILIMSGHSEATANAHADLGIAGFLRKPFTRRQLQQAVEQALVRSPG